MCVAIPYQIIKVLENGKAQIDVSGVRQEISMLLVPEAKAGDYVIAYLGSAVAKIEEEEAVKVMCLYQEMAEVELLPDISPIPEKALKAEEKQ